MIKWQVLNELKQNSQSYLSGEKISQKLSVSRMAVNKAIKSLREEGYKIAAFTNKGYKLLDTPDILSEYEIKSRLKTEIIGQKIKVFESLPSTNNTAKQMAEEGEREGTVVFAREQAGGKGRLARSFYSPKDLGVWMTVILRPKIKPRQATVFTIMAAVAVNNAIEKLCGIRPKIKWTNDILLNNKKVCGILTEMSIEAETQSVQHIVIGIGINVNNQSFPPEIAKTAVSLLMHTKKPQNKAQIAAGVLNELDRLYTEGYHDKKKPELIFLYRSDLSMLGKEIKLIRGNQESIVTALDIDENGCLIVQLGDKSKATVNSGEVSIRVPGGYI